MIHEGSRVQIPAWTDRWMRGDRFGVVVAGKGETTRLVRFDKSGRTVIVHLENLSSVD